MKALYHVGRYFLLMKHTFQRPENQSVYFRQILVEFENLGIASIGIVALISVFMGAVLVIQMAFNLDNPMVPPWAIGYAAKQSIVLEFSPTIISLILAGKVGSRIASEIGTMRVTEQIDALEIMGISPATYLILPKIIAAMVVNPLLIIMSMILAMGGGWLGGSLTNLVPTSEFVLGIQSFYKTYDIVYALIKTVVFAFLITSISSYNGFYTKGGALEVGAASTKGVVFSSVAIILSNLVLTQLLLV